MAFLLVVWSIKNVVCGIVCLLALAWTAPKFGPEDSNALQEQLDQIHENLGRHDVSHSLESIQAWMAPSFEALPKYSASSGIGSSAKPRLQTLAAKHLLHSYFNLHHGLNIEGLQSYNSQREPNRQALADSALVKRSNKLRAALQESPQGYSLSELASIALLLQRLVMKEIRITFKVAWRLRNHSASAELTWEELHEVFCAALAVAHDWDQVIINLESLKRGAPAVFHERFRIGQEFATGHVKSWRNIRKFVTKLSRKSLRPAPFYSFKTALPTYLALYMGYGNYQNFDCRDMKTQLSRLDSTGSGRLPLKAYSKEHSWFREYPSLVGYLHKLETLASFYPKSPSVVVTNFVDGSHNCVSAHSQFAFCCISECTSILRTYEAEVQAPEASPEELLRITAMSMPFVNLTDALVVRLHNISSITGGKVHLHGRLFAEWLHVLVPYKCPWPSPRWREDDRAHLSNAPVDGREVPLESWYSESMRDLQRLLDDGIWTPDVHWSDDELLPLFEEPPELLKTKCAVSVIHLLVQIVVIAAGLNDLIWLCHWWHLPSQGSPGAVEDTKKELMDSETSPTKNTTSGKSLQLKGSATKKDQPKAQKKAKASSKGIAKEKTQRNAEHPQVPSQRGGEPDTLTKIARDDKDDGGSGKLKVREDQAEDSSAVASRSTDSEEEVAITSSGAFDPGEFGSAMSKAAARVATSRAAAAAAVAAVRELSFAAGGAAAPGTSPAHPSANAAVKRGLGVLYRAGRLLTRRRQAESHPSWRCSTTVIPSAVNL